VAVEVFGGLACFIWVVYSGNTKVDSEIWLWGKKNERRRKDGGRAVFQLERMVGGGGEWG